jgi:G3E family GTPase
MKSLEGELVPETVEYGVNSFVYKRRRPFHPVRFEMWHFKSLFECRRTFKLWHASLALQEGTKISDQAQGDDEEHDHDHDHDHDGEEEEEDEAEEDEEEEAVPMTDEEKIQQALEFRQRKEGGLFKTIYRSKGSFWLASRNNHIGTWSQAGLIAQIGNEGETPFMCRKLICQVTGCACGPTLSSFYNHKALT